MKFLLAALLLPLLMVMAHAELQTATTDKGTLDVRLAYDHINPNARNVLDVEFIDPETQRVQAHIDYTVAVSKEGRVVFGPIPLTHTSPGSVSIPIEFSLGEGVYTVDLGVEGILFQPISRETASFEILVGVGNMPYDASRNRQTYVEYVDRELETPKEIQVPASESAKETAMYWNQGDIDDTEFINFLQFLIDKELITVPNSAPVDELEAELADLKAEFEDLKASIATDMVGVYLDGYGKGYDDGRGNLVSDPNPPNVQVNNNGKKSHSNTITINTDKSFYNYGETVTISGMVDNMLDESLVVMIITSPNGDVVGIQQLHVDPDGTFGSEHSTDLQLMRDSGEYTVVVTYGSNARTASTTFGFSGISNAPSFSPISAGAVELQVPAPFVDGTEDPQYYVDRYESEEAYKAWFDEHYSEYDSIYHAVGLDPPSVVPTADDVGNHMASPRDAVTIFPVAGSSVPGCESTSEGCYVPSTSVVRLGGTVTMSNTSPTAHTFTAGSLEQGNTGEFDTGLLAPGTSFEYKPDKTDEISYYCLVHPWMAGTIVVK